MFIGREPGCELRLDNLNVSRRHARICWEKGRFMVEDLGSSNGTLVNAQPIEKKELAPEDEIVIGKFIIRMLVPTATPAPQATMMMSATADRKLYLVGEDSSVAIIDEVSVGKAEGVDVRVKGFGIKPIHARLKNNGDGTVRLTCIGKAKVVVKGEKVQAAQLTSDQGFSVGRFDFKVLDIPQYADVKSG
jgi:pSer/pThr/pTyr-binding forkhead associated (FHA) protein